VFSAENRGPEQFQKPKCRIASEIKKTRKAFHKLVQTEEVKEYATEKGSCTKQAAMEKA